ncbi:hypothetical protein NP493_480g03046 [Ridgeia piscesae]|uniref:C2 domain-containing protein n=1 Tax=Ridgeia piscesae TaxID=27915 RepID=A0AAD9NT21_RIDPI|nr:hypothetical protein NP493_480g03046 [Ridgeia piscesae]
MYLRRLRSSGSSPSMIGKYSADEYWAWLRSDTTNKSSTRLTLPRRQASVDSVLDLKPSYQSELPTSARHSPRHRPAISHLRQLTPPAYHRRTRSEPHATVKHTSVLQESVEVGPELFRLHQPDIEAMRAGAAVDLRCDGDLGVRVYSGRGLGSSNASERALYCVLEVDSAKTTKTRISHGVADFEWNEEFQLELRSARELCLQLYRWDAGAVSNRLCFSGALVLRQFLQYGHRQKVALKLEPKGILYMELTFVDITAELQRCDFEEESC